MAGYLFLPVTLVLFGSTSLSFSQIPVDLKGKVTTNQGTAAFDVVLTLQNAKISDTADTAGNYHLFRQGTGILRNNHLISHTRIDNGLKGKMVYIGGSLTERKKSIDAIVIDLQGRFAGPAGKLFAQNRNVFPQGIYFLYGSTSYPGPYGNIQAKLDQTALDTSQKLIKMTTHCLG